MNLVVLSFYFRPDLSAGSFRNSALVGELSADMGEDDRIIVITTMPNRYKAFSARTQALPVEIAGNMTIHRVPVGSHASGVVDQSFSFIRFAWAAVRILAGLKVDLVFASSSRLMTAALGGLVARWKRAPLYLDIRDLFVDTVPNIVGSHAVGLAKILFGYIEAITFRRANKICVVSEGFLPYLRKKYPAVPVSFFPNGIDPDFLNLEPIEDVVESNRGVPKELLYAGNIGQGQGLEKIIPDLAHLLEGRWRISIIGAGGTMDMLKARIAERGLTNVTIHPPMERALLVERYRRTDCLFLHLNDYEAFLKVLPSKIFEYAALGKPLIAGVNGYAAQFIRNNVGNAAVFVPCDVAGAVDALNSIALEPTPRPEFVEKFQRLTITRRMARDVLDLATA